MKTTQESNGVVLAPSTVRRCGTCIHYGEIRIAAGKRDDMACLAPITTEPPPNGQTTAKYRFVYVAGDPNGLCELWTPFPPNTEISNSEAATPEKNYENHSMSDNTKEECPHCGSEKDPWFSRCEPMGYHCPDCGKDVDADNSPNDQIHPSRPTKP